MIGTLHIQFFHYYYYYFNYSQLEFHPPAFPQRNSAQQRIIKREREREAVTYIKIPCGVASLESVFDPIGNSFTVTGKSTDQSSRHRRRKRKRDGEPVGGTCHERHAYRS